jgi:hypothetical protein
MFLFKAANMFEARHNFPIVYIALPVSSCMSNTLHDLHEVYSAWCRYCSILYLYLRHYPQFPCACGPATFYTCRWGSARHCTYLYMRYCTKQYLFIRYCPLLYPFRRFYPQCPRAYGTVYHLVIYLYMRYWHCPSRTCPRGISLQLYLYMRYWPAPSLNSSQSGGSCGAPRLCPTSWAKVRAATRSETCLIKREGDSVTGSTLKAQKLP